MVITLAVMSHDFLEPVLEAAKLTLTVWFPFGPGPPTSRGRGSATPFAKKVVKKEKKLTTKIVEGGSLEPVRREVGRHCCTEVGINSAAFLPLVTAREENQWTLVQVRESGMGRERGFVQRIDMGRG